MRGSRLKQAIAKARKYYNRMFRRDEKWMKNLGYDIDEYKEKLQQTLRKTRVLCSRECCSSVKRGNSHKRMSVADRKRLLSAEEISELLTEEVLPMKLRRNAIKVYVAGPYSASTPMEVFGNMHKGTKASVNILAKGGVPFCPWLDFLYFIVQDNSTMPIERIYAYSLEWLRVCNVMYVLPGSENSRGVKIELAEAARLNIQVYYDIEELYKYLAENLGEEYEIN